LQKGHALHLPGAPAKFHERTRASALQCSLLTPPTCMLQAWQFWQATDVNPYCARCPSHHSPAVCPAGRYELCTTAAGVTTCDCVACGTAFYCPGGARDAANKAPAAQRGVRFSCHQAQVNAADTTASVQALGLTTLGNRSTTHAACLPMPGWR
jgi:ferredoxin-like protein FixX